MAIACTPGRRRMFWSAKLSTFGLSALLCTAAMACEDKKEVDKVEEPDAGTGPVLGGKLGEAVAAASANPPDGGATPMDDGKGPPPAGVFGPGRADEAHASNAPPKVEVLGQGSAPQVMITVGRPKKDDTLDLLVAVKIGAQQSMQPIIIELKALGTKEAAGEPGSPSSPATSDVRWEIQRAQVAAPPESVPKAMADVISSMKGSVLSYQLTATGPAFYKTELAKKADQQLGVVLQGALDVLSAAMVAPTDKPVGVGGYWMVTDRIESLGIDVIRYRVFKVEKMDGDNVELSLDTRQYAAGPEFNLDVGAQGANLSVAQYDAQGKGLVPFVVGSATPMNADVSQAVRAALAPPGAMNAGAQAQMAVLQIEAAGKVGLPPGALTQPAAPGIPGGAPPGGAPPGGAPPGGAPPGGAPPGGAP